jgi:hypothetical protein
MITKEELKKNHSYLTASEIDSLYKYKGSYYEIFNHYLTTGHIPKNDLTTNKGEIDKDIENILSAMKKHKKEHLGKKINKVFRGIGLDKFSGKKLDQLSFMSTTTDIDKTVKFLGKNLCCIFKITIDDDLLFFNFNDSEKEILFEPGISLIIGHQFIYNADGKKIEIYDCAMKKMEESEIKIAKQLKYKQESKKISHEKKMKAYKDTKTDLEKDMEEMEELFDKDGGRESRKNMKNTKRRINVRKCGKSRKCRKSRKSRKGRKASRL